VPFVYFVVKSKYALTLIPVKLMTKGEVIMREKVEEAINKIRPMLQADGGDVELVDVQEGVVTVRLQGAKNGIEKILKKEIPEVVSVESAP
jgi:Fe-S cluster biogenesis protein NfuA